MGRAEKQELLNKATKDFAASLMNRNGIADKVEAEVHPVDQALDMQKSVDHKMDRGLER
jgi:hypothetical protein